MTVQIFQRGFNFSQDGPGNRLVYHLQGCTMRCPWCSNPEGIAPGGCIVATDKRADALCPCGAVHDGRPDARQCEVCDKPCLTRRNAHLKWSCRSQTIEEVLREIDSAQMMFFDGGGVTFTGGEATMQFDALSALLTALHAKGIHTALETNGTHKDLPKLFEYIDYLIMDFKHPDNDTHERVIGCGNRQTLDNIRKAAGARTQLLVRIPLVGGFNSGADDAKRFARALSFLHGEQSVEVLRYHEYGKDKWKQCGMDYAMHDAFVSDDSYRTFCRVLTQSGLRLIHT